MSEAPPKSRALATENQENLPPRTVLGALQQNAASRPQNQRAAGKQVGMLPALSYQC